MTYFINGIGIVSPQQTYATNIFPDDVIWYDGNVLHCQTPDFKQYISPVQLRRLSRMLRIGLTASILCQRDAGLTAPDGIITGTGYGFLEETEKFLREIIDRKEQQISPTFFMQGTYNALAGLVALSLKCTGYNNTYVSKGFAFEDALMDAMLQINTNPALQFLVGGYDEAAEVQYKTGLREGHYKEEKIRSEQLFDSTTRGTIQGEGSAFFALSGIRSPNTWCEIADVRTIYRPDTSVLAQAFHDMLAAQSIDFTHVDLIVSGVSGDQSADSAITTLLDTQAADIPTVRFKHLCGEFCTAVTFGLYLGATILRHQHIPDVVRMAGTSYPDAIRTIVIVNQYLGRNYSLTILRRVSG